MLSYLWANRYREKPTLVWALARNELRVCARMSRTKLVLALFCFICSVYFVLVTNWHMQNSGVVPMYGVISPRYIASLFGSDLLTLFCLGTLLFTFDMRHRDENNRIREIIDSQPINSIELFLGRLLGIFLLIGTPMFMVVALAVGWGVISEIFSIPFGEPIEPWSVASFLILDVIPSFIFWGSFTLFLVSAIRSRILVLVLTLFCLFAWVWFIGRLPLHISTPLQTVTANVIFPSDLIPTFFTLETFLNRVALVLFGFGFLYWLSHIYPRNNLSPTPQIRRALYCFIGGIILIIGMFGAQTLEYQKIAAWIRVHDAHFDPNSFPDVKHVEGTIEIYPGRSVSLDLNMSVSVSEHNDADVLFSFNPGYRIANLFIDGEVIKDRKFRNGLLKIPRHYFDGDVANLRLEAKGRPKAQFAYLDSVERLFNVIGPAVRQLQYLGTENYIFRPEFVVLMPGIKWYPVAGTATREDHWEQRPKDFFTVDLKISVPRKWMVAGPAQRKLLPEEKRTTYRFRTSNPIPQLALVASRFEHASHTIDGVEYEVLYSRQHRKTFETLILTGEEYLVRLQEHLDKIDSLNLTYPHTVLSLVEVPAPLRAFGGSKELEPVLGMPGILMMPETTLPTMHAESLHPYHDFERQRGKNPYTYEEWMRRKAWFLDQYFGIELYTGNHVSHFSRSLVSDQISATGTNAELLNRILKHIMQLYIFEYENSFDFDLALDLDLVDLTKFDPIEGLSAFKRIFDKDRFVQLHDLRYARTHKMKSDAVFDVVSTLQLSEHTTLSDHLSIEEQRALRVRSLAMSKALIDTLGSERLSAIIAELIARFRGQNFSYGDFLVAVHSQGINFEEHFYDMLHSTHLPGFLVSDITQRRVQVEEADQVIYQVSFILENGEPVAGLCNVKPVTNKFYWEFPHEAPSNSVFVEKNQRLEVIVESELPVTDILVEPYLSLNRTSILASVPPPKDVSDDTPESGAHPRIVSILPTEKSRTARDLSIVIDDLDSGFSVTQPSKPRYLQNWGIQLLRRLSGASDIPQLRGLPEFQYNNDVVQEDTWQRMSHRDAHGKYWRTLVLNERGRGESFAKFATQLTSEGTWRLEYFVPKGWLTTIHHYWRSSQIYHYGMSHKGVAKIDVKVNSDVIPYEIDFSGADLGWFEIGQYDIEELEVEVRLSNPNYSGVVFADAIRWTLVEDKD